MLTAEQQATYQDQGYLVLPGFKPRAEVDAAVARAQALVDAFDPGAGASRFSTRDRSLVADERLLASADQVHCFFEEEALDTEGRLRVPKAQSINKIGHALHDRDPFFDAFSHGPELAAVAQGLGLAQPQIWQSMVIFKQPHIGGEVGWHQDASFFVTDPFTVTTFWFALEDATLDNGCLWAEPGGHRGHRGVLRERYVCDQGRLRMEHLDDTPWPDIASDTPRAVALPVRLDDAMPLDTAFIPFAYAEAAANLLTNPALDPVGKIAELKYCAVDVRPAKEPAPA